MANQLCKCLRCRKVVEKRSGSMASKAVFYGSWLTIIPYAGMCAVAGGGVFVMAPLTIVLGCAIIGAFAPKAFPKPHCPECRASLEDAPEVKLVSEPVPQSRPIPA